MRVYGYRYITEEGVRERGLRRCACKRVKRRDIFYIYGYLPLLCSRAGGLRQRANVPLFPLPLLLLLLSLSLSPSTRFVSLTPPFPQVSPFPSRRVLLGAGRATGGRTMCHLRCHPIFRSYHDMLKARSTLTLDILYRCARLSHIYI